MIENNVITRNLQVFQDNPFLMSEPVEAKKIMNLLPKCWYAFRCCPFKVSANT